MPLTLRAGILPFALLLFRAIVDSVRVWHVPDVSLGRDADLLEDAGLLQPVDAHLGHTRCYVISDSGGRCSVGMCKKYNGLV